MTTTPAPDLSILGEQPEHLKEASAAAAERIQKKMQAEVKDKQEAKERGDPKGQEKYTFELKYRDGRGKIWKGTFTNTAPTIQSRQAMALLQSEWQFGKPFESIDPDVAAMNTFLAHMQFTLHPHEDAGWARNGDGNLELRNLHDDGIIRALWMEVASHEATFLGRQPPQEGREKDS